MKTLSNQTLIGGEDSPEGYMAASRAKTAQSGHFIQSQTLDEGDFGLSVPSFALMLQQHPYKMTNDEEIG